MNYKNRFYNLYLKPSKEGSGLPLFNISASLSIKSTISLVKLQSHSFTVHFVLTSISSLSSKLNFLYFKPIIK